MHFPQESFAPSQLQLLTANKGCSRQQRKEPCVSSRLSSEALVHHTDDGAWTANNPPFVGSADARHSSAPQPCLRLFCFWAARCGRRHGGHRTGAAVGRACCGQGGSHSPSHSTRGSSLASFVSGTRNASTTATSAAALPLEGAAAGHRPLRLHERQRRRRRTSGKLFCYNVCVAPPDRARTHPGAVFITRHHPKGAPSANFPSGDFGVPRFSFWSPLPPST